MALCCLGTTGWAAENGYRVAEQGWHHRVWQRTTSHLRADGTTVQKATSYTELASGLNFRRNGEWVESKAEIELFEGGAIARQGQHQVIWTPNINTAGAIDLLTADGKRFRSHVLGLAYTDKATGNSLMIAEVKDSIGQLAAPNQIIYPDAFTDFQADIRYTYTIGGFEQDIILREEPPSPAVYGLNPETTLLEVYTEFIEAPVPKKRATPIRQETDPLARAAMVEPDLVDEFLDFGTTVMGPGNAFSANQPEENTTPVGKSWEVRDGRTVGAVRTSVTLLAQDIGNTFGVWGNGLFFIFTWCFHWVRG